MADGKTAKILKIVLLAAVWTAVAGYIVYAAVLASRQRRVQTVGQVDIRISDSTATRRMVSCGHVLDWLNRAGIQPVGMPVGEVDVAAIRSLVASKGFVGAAAAYVSPDGTLHIEIRQRRPVMRFMCEGYDVCATADGHIFSTPEGAVLYVPVVTGSYTPPFAPSFEGSLPAVLDSLRRATDEAISHDELVKRSLGHDIENMRKAGAAARDNTVKRRDRDLSGKDGSELDAAEKMWTKRLKDTLYLYNSRVAHLQEQTDALTARQKRMRRELTDTEARYAAFGKLTAFESGLPDEPFWGQEIVQTIAEPTFLGGIDISIIPRSGNFRVVLGDVWLTEQRLDKLKRFYDKGLSNIGWDRYKVINLRYADRVICSQ